MVNCEWKKVYLKDAVDFLDHLRKPVSSSDRAKMKGVYPYYGASGIVDYVNDYIYNEPLILLGEDGENILSRNLPLAFLVDGKIWVNNHAHVLRAKEGVNREYLCAFLESIDYTDLNSGTAQPKLNQKKCKNIEIYLPEFEEQAAIAEALSDVDNLISSLQKLIEKKKAIKQGAMQELLTGKKRLPGFSGEWNEGRIGDYCQCIRGVSYNGGTDLFSDENNYSFRLLRANNIQNGHFVPNDVQFVIKSCVPEERVLHTDDILVCMANGSKPLVGKNCFLNVRNGVYTFGAFMGCVRARTPSTCMKYIFQIMNSTTYCGNISLLLSGSSINNLRPNDILNMTYKFPTVIEQQAIAQVLSDMDSEIEKLEKKLSKYQQVKQGMMQELLTGRIRLVDIDSKEQLPAQGVQEKQPQEEG